VGVVNEVFWDWRSHHIVVVHPEGDKWRCTYFSKN